MKKFLFILLLVGANFLTACGQDPEGNIGETIPAPVEKIVELPPVALVLQRDEIYPVAEFWDGVERKELHWIGDSGVEMSFDLDLFEFADFEIVESGNFEVLGLDIDGKVLVFGKVRFDLEIHADNSRQKNLVISLARQEYDYR